VTRIELPARTLSSAIWTVARHAFIGAPFRPLRGGRDAQVAQLVEHVTENHGVGGSIPPLGTKPFSLRSTKNID
jgi:hypothetical protein